MAMAPLLTVEASFWVSVYLVVQQGTRRINEGLRRSESVLVGKGAMRVTRGTRRAAMSWFGQRCLGETVRGFGWLGKVVRGVILTSCWVPGAALGSSLLDYVSVQGMAVEGEVASPLVDNP